jgi:DNA invertase Pin-like site-specific DNA recombinase
MDKRVALYVRVSTDKQTTENQENELHQAIAARGWRVVKTYSDPGISGAKGRDKRPGLDACLKAAIRREFDVLAVWSVDRLGRSLRGLLHTLEDLQSAKVDLYLHKQALDTSTSAGRALYGMLGVFAEFEREIIAERVRAGMNKPGAGKPGRKVDASTRRAVHDLAALGLSHRKIAAELGISPATVRRRLREAPESL